MSLLVADIENTGLMEQMSANTCTIWKKNALNQDINMAGILTIMTSAQMGRHSFALCTFPLTVSEAMNQITTADIHSEFTKLQVANPLKDHMQAGRKLQGMEATQCIGDTSELK
jgi:hypothetical protein